MWKPVDTAPKDGTAVLVFGKGDFASAPYIGVREWTGFRWAEPNISAHDLDDWLDGTEVTHWMPLPDPPT